MPFCSKDGRWIYFVVTVDQKGIWKVAAEGGTAIQWSSDEGILPQESADGTRVFYGKRSAMASALRN
jgi:Tol biopolymer transport system component